MGFAILEVIQSVKVIIPARFESSRFPGKPLAMISGETLLHRVIDRCSIAVGTEHVIVATDNQRVLEHAKEKGVQALLTSRDNKTGMDRVAEAMRELNLKKAVNVQGDEPLVDPRLIKSVALELEGSEAVVHCSSPIHDQDEFLNFSIPKLVVDTRNNLMFASRSPIPVNKLGQPDISLARKQVCVYGVNRSNLDFFGPGMEKTPIEAIEDVEILRFLERGINVMVVESDYKSIAVDYPDDINRVERLLAAT